MQGTDDTHNHIVPGSIPRIDGPRRARRRWGALLVACLLVAGCKVTDKDLKHWASSKDSGRLSRVVGDSKQKLPIRIKAALLLLEIKRYYELEKALKGSAKPARHKIAGAVADKLLPKLDAPAAGSAHDVQAAVAAKDGLFSVWYFADPDKRRLIEEAIVAWILRGQTGEEHEHSIKKILDAFGQRGADLLAQKIPYYDPNFFRYDSRTVVSSGCLLGMFWKRVSPGVRKSTVDRYIKAASKSQKAALLNNGALLCAIGVLGKRRGSRYLANALSTHGNTTMKAAAAVALRLAAAADREGVDPDVQAAVVRELNRIMANVNAGKPLDNPVYRGTGYLFHLLELATKFPGEEIFKGLTPVVAAPTTKLANNELEDKRTQLRLLTVGFLMRVDPEKALTLAYDKLPPDQDYHLGYLNSTILDNAVYIWKKYKNLRPKLLKGLRLGLTKSTWLAKIIGVEGLALKELLPRKGVKGDIAALKKLVGDKTKLQGDDWKDATLGKRAKKAVEVLSKSK